MTVDDVPRCLDCAEREIDRACSTPAHREHLAPLWDRVERRGPWRPRPAIPRGPALREAVEAMPEHLARHLEERRRHE